MNDLAKLIKELAVIGTDLLNNKKVTQAALVFVKIEEIAEILGLDDAMDKFKSKVTKEFGELVNIEDITQAELDKAFAESDIEYAKIKQKVETFQATQAA